MVDVAAFVGLVVGVPPNVANCVATVLAMIASSMCVLKGHGGGSFHFACSARTHLLSQAVKR